MASTYKVLGQLKSTGAAMQSLYTVPAATSAIGSTLTATTSGSTALIRVAVQTGGQALADKQFILFDVPINQYDSYFLTFPITLASTDVVSVYSSTGTVMFNLFGCEIV